MHLTEYNAPKIHEKQCYFNSAFYGEHTSLEKPHRFLDAAVAYMAGLTFYLSESQGYSERHTSQTSDPTSSLTVCLKNIITRISIRILVLYI